MPAEGADAARVAVIEFSDYECPYCARHATVAFPELRDRFISTGKVRYVFANFPLPNHRNAEMLAGAAICAGKQDAYWKMHDALFGTRPRDTESMLALGKQLGLEMKRFEACLGERRPLAERIQTDQEIARGFQISGTPSFVLGVIDAQGRVVAQDIIVGAQPFAAFESAITPLLNR
jgi:protein-disulfide isomerase